MKKLLYFTALLGVIGTSESIAMNGFNRSEISAQLFARLGDNRIVTRIETSAQQVNSDIHIRHDARAIDDHAFRDNQHIVNVTCNYDMRYIGEYSFANSSIESIALGRSLSIIRRYAFAGCQNLHEVILPDSLNIIELNAFAGSGVNYLSVPAKFMVYSERDNKGNLAIFMMPVNAADGGWRKKIMTLAPDQELTVVTRRGFNQDVATTFSAESSSDSEG